MTVIIFTCNYALYARNVNYNCLIVGYIIKPRSSPIEQKLKILCIKLPSVDGIGEWMVPTARGRWYPRINDALAIFT